MACQLFCITLKTVASRTSNCWCRQRHKLKSCSSQHQQGWRGAI